MGNVQRKRHSKLLLNRKTQVNTTGNITMLALEKVKLKNDATLNVHKDVGDKWS